MVNGATERYRMAASRIPDRVLVVGLGASGASCVRFLAGLGKKVTVTDAKEEGALLPILQDPRRNDLHGPVRRPRAERFSRP